MEPFLLLAFGVIAGASSAWLVTYFWYEHQNISYLEKLIQAKHDAGVTQALYEVSADRLRRIREIVEEA